MGERVTMSEMMNAFSIAHDWPHILALLECETLSQVQISVVLANTVAEGYHLVVGLSYTKWADGEGAEPYRGLYKPLPLSQLANLNNFLWNTIMSEYSEVIRKA